MRPIRTIPGLLVLLLAVAGCQDDPAEPSPGAAELTVTLDLASTTVAPGKPVEVRVVGENRSDRACTYRFSSSCDGAALVSVDGEERPMADPRACLAVAGKRTLAPGESTGGTWSWNGEILTRDGPAALAPGTYVVVGVVDTFRSAPVTVTVVE